MFDRLKRKKNFQGTHLSDQRGPDISGSDADIWRVRLRAPSERVDQTWDATLGIWFVYARSVNAHFPYYAGVLVHLRSTVGHAEPYRENPNCLYDFAVFALDPENAVPNLQLVEACDGTQGPQICTLDPAEFTAQFQDVGGDETAIAIVDKLMAAIATGDLIPAQTHRLRWAQALTLNVIDAVTLRGRG